MRSLDGCGIFPCSYYQIYPLIMLVLYSALYHKPQVTFWGLNSHKNPEYRLASSVCLTLAELNLAVLKCIYSYSIYSPQLIERAWLRVVLLHVLRALWCFLWVGSRDARTFPRRLSDHSLFRVDVILWIQAQVKIASFCLFFYQRQTRCVLPPYFLCFDARRLISHISDISWAYVL